MQIVAHGGEISSTRADLIVVGVHADDVKNAPQVKEIDRVLGGSLRAAIGEERFEGKPKQKLVLHTAGRLSARRVALVGLGLESGAGTARCVSLGGTATRMGNAVGAGTVLVLAPANAGSYAAISALARGALLGGYRFDRFKSDPNRKPTVAKVAIAVSGVSAAFARAPLVAGEAVGEAVALARDLVNEPPQELFPESFARRAADVAKSAGLRIKVYAPQELQRLGMRLLLGVGAGSDRPPRLVHLIHAPAGARRVAPIVLVGKGITFDSGGLCLKPPKSMAGMKNDMAGAAAVLATLQAATRLHVPFPVHGLLALAENMPSGSALRLGDVVRSAAGKSVEITNTDAEGRLVLADALRFATGLKPRRIVDVATLTGACAVALGPRTAGLFSSDDALAGELLASAERAGEDLWRLPLTAALEEQLKSDIADLKNAGDGGGGAITAALFLKQFVGDTPWAHLDIAGPATSNQEDGAEAKGATGVSVALLSDWLAHDGSPSARTARRGRR